MRQFIHNSLRFDVHLRISSSLFFSNGRRTIKPRVWNSGVNRLIFYGSLPEAIRKMIKFLDLKKVNQEYQQALTSAVQRVSESGSYIRGQEVSAFEGDYASYTGSKNCVGVGNGFDALRLIFKAWLISGVMKEGDEVIVPANTYIASILAITDNRLVPVLCEADIGTYNIDSSLIVRKISPRTRAILLVHLYGRNSFSEGIRKIAAENNLRVIEDNAHAAGCAFAGKRTGSLGHAAAHSFFPTKNLGALGDGGAVTTDDGELAAMVRTLGNYGSHKKGVNNVQGVNSRLDEMQAAVLRVKLRGLDRDNDIRRSIAHFYLRSIRNPRIVLPSAPAGEEEHVWHLFVVRCNKRDELQQFLADQGVETMIHYPLPPHLQGAYGEWNQLKIPLTERIHGKVLSLPLHPALGRSEMQKIVEVVNACQF